MHGWQARIEGKCLVARARGLAMFLVSLGFIEIQDSGVSSTFSLITEVDKWQPLLAPRSDSVVLFRPTVVFIVRLEHRRPGAKRTERVLHQQLTAPKTLSLASFEKRVSASSSLPLPSSEETKSKRSKKGKVKLQADTSPPITSAPLYPALFAALSQPDIATLTMLYNPHPLIHRLLIAKPTSILSLMESIPSLQSLLDDVEVADFFSTQILSLFIPGPST